MSKFKVLAESVSPLLGSLVSVLAREGGLWRLYEREYDAISPHLRAEKCKSDLFPIYYANGKKEFGLG